MFPQAQIVSQCVAGAETGAPRFKVLQSSDGTTSPRHGDQPGAPKKRRRFGRFGPRETEFVCVVVFIAIQLNNVKHFKAQKGAIFFGRKWGYHEP